MADRFEREIEEILRKNEDFLKGGAKPRRESNDLGRRIGSMQRSLAVRLSHVSVSQVMLTALGLMVVSYLFRGLFSGIWMYGLTLGLILFFTAFVLSFRGNHGRSSEPYFRGQPRSAYQSPSPSLGSRLRDWWNSRRYRR